MSEAAARRRTSVSRSDFRVAVVIPALDEAATIQDLVIRATPHCETIVVVDDGSTDNTSGVLADGSATVLRNCQRMGKASSLWRGIEHCLTADVDAVVTLDGDGQHEPEHIPTLIEAAARSPDSIVIAARLLQREAMPAARRFGNAVADFWIGWAAGFPIRDSQSGFRLYPSSLLRDLNLRHDAQRGFVFESEVLIEGARLGFLPTLVPVNCIYQNTLRPSHFRPIRDTAQIVRMVGGRLVRQGMHPLGLLRSLGLLTSSAARYGIRR